MHRLAIFVSGGGSNARKIIEHFENHPSIEVGLLVANKKNIGALSLCQEYMIPSLILDKDIFYNSNRILKILELEKINTIILAGFLWLVPKYLIEAYPNQILNIHPSLLPKYGGPGMYGHHVHQAVKSAGEDTSGMTIHLVNEEFDKGKILFQESCKLTADDTAEDIAAMVLTLEHRHYAPIIEHYILESNS